MRKNDGTPYREKPRTEIIGGEVVTLPTPLTNHEIVAENIYGIFCDYLHERPRRVFYSNLMVYLDDGDEYLPDVKVVCDRSKIQKNGIHGAPDLVAEVLSSSTARYDRGRKMRVYERSGVREYWIADPANRTLEQYVLTDGRFVLRDLYAQFDEYDLSRMSEKELAAVVDKFPCAIFEDLIVSVADVFADLGEW